jgi:predicted nucleic acid-binding protein
MTYLLDTNILLRFLDETSPEYSLVQAAIATLRKQDNLVYLTPQVVIEFWAVATRPRTANGFGWTIERAAVEVKGLLNLFSLLPDNTDIFAEWLELVTTYQVSGKQVHDARLAATAKAHDVENLLTLNVADFKRFDLKAVHPNEVIT